MRWFEERIHTLTNHLVTQRMRLTADSGNATSGAERFMDSIAADANAVGDPARRRRSTAPRAHWMVETSPAEATPDAITENSDYGGAHGTTI